MPPTTRIPLSLEEHRELGGELRRTKTRLHQLNNLINVIYGPNSRSSFQFQKTVEAMDRLCAEMQAQVAHDLPGFDTEGFYN